MCPTIRDETCSRQLDESLITFLRSPNARRNHHQTEFNNAHATEKGTPLKRSVAREREKHKN